VRLFAWLHEMWWWTVEVKMNAAETRRERYWTGYERLDATVKSTKVI
jgi:hypothetical protein